MCRYATIYVSSVLGYRFKADMKSRFLQSYLADAECLKEHV